jgi:RNA polymerase sigma-70 factor (ECF subfamily)
MPSLSSERRLCAEFLRIRPCALDERAVERLERALEAASASAQRQWPGIQVEPGAFVSALAGNLPAAWTPEQGFAAWCVSDLYLTVAAAKNEANALARFEELLASPAVMGVVEHFRKDGVSPADVRQRLLERLLLAEPGRAPRLATYSGRGPLTEWLRVGAARVAVDLQRQVRSKVVPLDEAAALPLDDTDPELVILRRRHGEQLTQAMRTAFDQLSDRDVNVLRMHFLDGVSPENIGKLYGVNRTTVWRWMTQARGGWMTATRVLLMDALHLTDTQVASLMRDMKSGFHVSLGRWLEERR